MGVVRDLPQHIIIGGDINHDVYEESSLNWFEDNGLCNTYDINNKKAPETYKYNNNNRTIDAILATQGIKII